MAVIIMGGLADDERAMMGSTHWQTVVPSLACICQHMGPLNPFPTGHLPLSGTHFFCQEIDVQHAKAMLHSPNPIVNIITLFRSAGEE